MKKLLAVLALMAAMPASAYEAWTDCQSTAGFLPNGRITLACYAGFDSGGVEDPGNQANYVVETMVATKLTDGSQQVLRREWNTQNFLVPHTYKPTAFVVNCDGIGQQDIWLVQGFVTWGQYNPVSKTFSEIMGTRTSTAEGPVQYAGRDLCGGTSGGGGGGGCMRGRHCD